MWNKYTARGKLLLILAAVNLWIAFILASANTLNCIFSFCIALICWIGTYDRRSIKK